MDPVELQVVALAGAPYCVASDDGQRVHGAVAEHLRAGRPVRLSFAGVEGLTSAFLNAAIGQLYGEFPPDRIRALLSVEGLGDADLLLLKRVVDRAKAYFADRGQFEDAWARADDQ
ncbi:MAG TPA: STAS-like domain-containing protein [bacterium]|nr:STAS-like domain-containing protein [bacterium]